MAITTFQTILNAVTATTTSDALSLEGVKKATIELTRAAHDSGSSAFTVLVSVDGTTYSTFNKIITNTANTNAQDLIRVAGITLNANGTTIASLDLVNDVYKYMKIKVTETTDGTHTAKVALQF